MQNVMSSDTFERATVLAPLGGGGAAPTTHSSMVNRLSLLVDLASLLTREVDFDALLATACERVAEALSAERATIWLVDAEHGDLVSRVAVQDRCQRPPQRQS